MAKGRAMGSGGRAFLLGMRGSYWFVPSLLILAALGLALGTLALDRAGHGAFLAHLSPSAEGARQQLQAVTSAMLTVAATVFAITIAAVSFASGNFGPRILTNFMHDRGNQISLGVFVATFVYNLLVLRSIRAAGEEGGGFVPHLSICVSLLTVAAAVITLVYFLHHIPASIRINTMVAGIGRRLLADIARRFPREGSGKEPEPRAPGTPVQARSAGYIEVIDFAALDEIAAEQQVVISLCARTGDFVHPAMALVEICDGDLRDECRDRLHRAFSLAEERTYLQDLEFLFDEMVEIALRALSPGINDPYTAVTSLHWMSAAMASLAGRDLCRGPEQEDYDPARVRPLADDFSHYLRRSFGSARSSVAPSPVAGKVFLDSLATVARAAATEERRRLVLEEGRTFLAAAETVLEGPSLAELRERLASFEEDVLRHGA
jgi:uncharacterized membrane protein